MRHNTVSHLEAACLSTVSKTAVELLVKESWVAEEEEAAFY